MKRPFLISVGVAISMIAPATPASFATNSPTASPTINNPYGAGAVDPASPNDPILTMRNGTKTLKFTMRNLLAMHPTEISIYEPFVKKRQKFTVISLSKLFGKLAISPTSTVVTKALNNYIYKNKALSFIEAKGYLAIKRNGKDIPYDQGGPIRLIYPDTSSWSKSLDPWNWSLSSITATK